MADPRFLSELLLLTAIAAAGVALFERLRLPAVAGFLVMGALVGPGGLGWVAEPERVRSLAELGVVFLLFEIGLELPIDRVRRMWRSAALAGGLQLAITVAAVTALAIGFGLPAAPAFVLGCVVAMSSTALVMRVLTERGQIDSPQGQLSVGILLFQDLCIVPLLLMVPLLAADQGHFSRADLAGLARALLGLLAFFLVARFALPKLLEWAVRLGSRDLFSLLALLVVLGSAAAAREIGVTLAVGAFIGGLVLAASPYAHQLFAEVVPLRGVLLGVFFTAVGMLLDPEAVLRAPGAVLAYTAAVVAIKSVVIAGIVAFALRRGLRLGVLTGLGLAQTGEFSFVLAAVALEAGLFDPALHQAFIAGSIATLIATPFLVDAAPHLASRLLWSAAAPAEDAADAGGISDHVVLLGYGLAGRTLARVFRSRGIPYEAVEANPTRVQELRALGEPVVYGDVTRRALLERIGVQRARLVVVAISDPIATREAVRLARVLAPRAVIAARTRYVLEVDALYGAGASVVVAEEFESTIELLAEVLRSFAIPESSIASFTSELRGEGYEPLRAPALLLDPWLNEILEQVGSEWIDVPPGIPAGSTLGGLEIRARSGASILAVESRGETTVNPPPGHPIAAGCRLLAFATPEQIDRVRRLLSARR